jgi:hypothetical protein|tara:strand:+ start:762 stop:1628 length:867 start_codon:yes stop_codon:yes gene_type:complete
MSKRTRNTSVAGWNKARSLAIGAYAENVAEATMATGAKNEADKKSAQYFKELGVVWCSAPPAVLANTERMRAAIEEDFEAAKDDTEKAVLAMHDAMVKAAKNGSGRPPALSRLDAKKNSTKGIRLRKIVLENTVETISKDPALALSTYTEAASGTLNWKQLCEILGASMLLRATETTMKIHVGTAADGRRQYMQPDYAKTHNVETRKLKSGTVEEFTLTTFGSKGDTELVEVVITAETSGEVLARALEELEIRKKLQAANNSIVRNLMAQARIPEFNIREARPRTDDT